MKAAELEHSMTTHLKDQDHPRREVIVRCESTEERRCEVGCLVGAAFAADPDMLTRVLSDELTNDDHDVLRGVYNAICNDGHQF